MLTEISIQLQIDPASPPAQLVRRRAFPGLSSWTRRARTTVAVARQPHPSPLGALRKVQPAGRRFPRGPRPWWVPRFSRLGVSETASGLARGQGRRGRCSKLVRWAEFARHRPRDLIRQFCRRSRRGAIQAESGVMWMAFLHAPPSPTPSARAGPPALAPRPLPAPSAPRYTPQVAGAKPGGRPQDQVARRPRSQVEAQFLTPIFSPNVFPGHRGLPTIRRVRPSACGARFLTNQ